jgi:hypothetical protein
MKSQDLRKAEGEISSSQTRGESERFATKRDIASMLSVSTRTLDNLLRKGLPHIALSRRKLLFDPAEVKNWIRERYSRSRYTSISAK